MRVTVEEISDESGFEKLLELPYSEIASFVISRMRNKTLPMFIFWASCVVTLALSVVFLLTLPEGTAIVTILGHTLLGFVVLPLLLIPVHEILHIVPMLIVGAKNIRVGADIKQFMFYVAAHREVINKKEFISIALAPFIILTLALTTLILSLPGIWKFSMASLLFVHTTVCAGDFGLIDFYHEHGKREIYTWDDADKKVAYFIAVKPESDN